VTKADLRSYLYNIVNQLPWKHWSRKQDFSYADVYAAINKCMWAWMRIAKDYGIDALGNIQASFSNGKTIPISKVAIYHFRNEEGLEKLGNSTFKESVNSGKAKFFKDKDGNTLEISSIKNNKIEMSNLNLTTALTDLIVMQKAYDASSKSITTSDQMIQNAINMKR